MIEKLQKLEQIRINAKKANLFEKAKLAEEAVDLTIEVLQELVTQVQQLQGQK